MRLLFITRGNPYGDRSFGGAESSIRVLAEKLAARGHRIGYLSRRVTPGAIMKASAQGVDLRKMTRINRGTISLVRRLKLAATLRTARAMFPDGAIDIIYCFYELQSMEVALWLRDRLPGRPKVVLRMAGGAWFVNAERDPRLRQTYDRMFGAVDAVNYLNPELIAMTEDWRQAAGMTFSFRNAFVQDIGSAAISARRIAYRALPRQPFRILMVARFSDYQKRQDILIRAAALLPPDLDFTVELVGEGEQKRRLQQLVDELSLTGRVTFTPFLPQPELWSRMQSSHLLCHATEFEGVSKAVVEAMAAGLPVLASDVAPLDEQIRDGETGFLAANDPQSFAAKILELIQDREKLANVSDAGLRFSATHYSASENAAGYERHFTSLLSG